MTACRRAARAVRAARRQRITPIAEDATRWSCRRTMPPERSSRELAAAGGQRRVAQSDARRRSRSTSSQQVRGTAGAARSRWRMRRRTVGLVALAVFRESVRDRVLYNLVGFAVLLIGASLLIGQLTAGQDVKIIKDLGLAAMSLFGCSSRSSSASAWCRRKWSGGASTACWPSRSARSELVARQIRRPGADAARQSRRDGGRAVRRARYCVGCRRERAQQRGSAGRSTPGCSSPCS